MPASGSRPSPAAGRSGLLVIMGATFVVALLVRVVYLVAFHQSPFFSQLMVDAQWHDEWAWEWAEGRWAMDDRAFFRAPLYPFFLSTIYKVLGHDLTALRAVQAILGAATAAALAGTGYRMGGRVVGGAAGLVAALYGTLVFFDGEVLIPNLLVALLSWTLFVLAARPTLVSSYIAGGLLGLAAIARPNVLILMPLVAVFVFRGAGSRGLREALRRSAGVVILGFLPMLGVTAVNVAVEGTWVFVASQGGVNFYAGNHARASGQSVDIPELQNILSWRQFVGQARAVAEKAEARPLDSREVSDWWFGRGVRWVASHPGDAARLYARKIYFLQNAYEIPNNRDLYFRQPAPLRGLLWKTSWFAFPWGLVFPLAIAGWVVAHGDGTLRRWGDFLGLWVVLYGAALIPFFITARFRLGVLPALIVLAGLALAHWRRTLRGWPLAVGLMALVLTNSSFLGVRAENPAHQLAMLGDSLLRSGRTAEGVAALEEARRTDPSNVGLANHLAEGYVRMERYEDALRLYEGVVAGRPDDPELRFNLGVANLALGRFEDAANAFEAAVRLAPDDPAAWVNLGAAHEGLKRFDRAESAYREGIRLAPTETLGYLRLAALLGPERAVSILQDGVEVNPRSFELRWTLAAALDQTGRGSEALQEVTRALSLRPDHPGARALKERLESRP